MNPDKSGKRDTPASKKEGSGTDVQIKRKKQWFHESSQTETEALRAMIGKEKIKLH